MYVCWPGNRIRNLHFLFKLVFLRTAIMGPLPASLKLIARTGWFHLMTLISNVWWNANSIFPRKIDDNLMKVNACGAISVIIRTNPIQKGRLFPWKTKMDDCEMVFVIFFEFLFLIGFVPFEDVCLFLSRMKKRRSSVGSIGLVRDREVLLLLSSAIFNVIISAMRKWRRKNLHYYWRTVSFISVPQFAGRRRGGDFSIRFQKERRTSFLQLEQQKSASIFALDLEVK